MKTKLKNNSPYVYWMSNPQGPTRRVEHVSQRKYERCPTACFLGTHLRVCNIFHLKCCIVGKRKNNDNLSIFLFFFLGVGVGKPSLLPLIFKVFRQLTLHPISHTNGKVISISLQVILLKGLEAKHAYYKHYKKLTKTA